MQAFSNNVGQCKVSQDLQETRGSAWKLRFKQNDHHPAHCFGITELNSKRTETPHLQVFSYCKRGAMSRTSHLCLRAVSEEVYNAHKIKHIIIACVPLLLVSSLHSPRLGKSHAAKSCNLQMYSCVASNTVQGLDIDTWPRHGRSLMHLKPDVGAFKEDQ